MKPVYFLCTILILHSPCMAAEPSAELIEVRTIWDQAPHSAFTDLIRWNDQFVCAFREGRAHVSSDGKIRVLTSSDGGNWRSAALVALDGFDLRDAGLSIAPAGTRHPDQPGAGSRLMLIGGAAPRKGDGEDAPTGTFVSFSDDAATWTTPTIVTEPGRWLWRVTWQDGKTYGVSYASHRGDRSSQLLVSDNGLKYHALAPKMLANGWPTEAVLRFDDQTAYCLQRRDGESPANTAMLGISKSPYSEWQWHDLGIYFGGPNFIQLPDRRWIAAGRIITPGEGPKTVLAELDVNDAKLNVILKLPSGGDNSYPGLVWHDDTLRVSYYSSHEGKAKIYLATIKLK